MHEPSDNPDRMKDENEKQGLNGKCRAHILLAKQERAYPSATASPRIEILSHSLCRLTPFAVWPTQPADTLQSKWIHKFHWKVLKSFFFLLESYKMVF